MQGQQRPAKASGNSTPDLRCPSGASQVRGGQQVLISMHWSGLGGRAPRKRVSPWARQVFFSWDHPQRGMTAAGHQATLPASRRTRLHPREGVCIIFFFSFETVLLEAMYSLLKFLLIALACCRSAILGLLFTIILWIPFSLLCWIPWFLDLTFYSFLVYSPISKEPSPYWLFKESMKGKYFETCMFKNFIPSLLLNDNLSLHRILG